MMHGTMSLKCKFAVSSESHTWHTIAMQSACVLFIVKPGGTYNNRIIIHVIIGFKILNNVVQKIPPLVFQRDGYCLPECDAVWLECIYQYCGEFCCLCLCLLYMFSDHLLTETAHFSEKLATILSGYWHACVVIRQENRKCHVVRFQSMAYCNLVCWYRRFWGDCCLHLEVGPTADWSNKLIRNTGNCLAVYVAPYTQKE